jgi:hypothetical protein
MWVFIDNSHLEFDVFDAMRCLRLGDRGRERLTEDDRRKIAASILDSFRQSGWRVVREKMASHSSPGASLDLVVQRETREKAERLAREDEIGGIEPQEPSQL